MTGPDNTAPTTDTTSAYRHPRSPVILHVRKQAPRKLRSSSTSTDGWCCEAGGLLPQGTHPYKQE
ncbi:hypothetical protein L917_11188 [Phytophthora nicotianae]|uniref:Uncharacterized protein n=2 Tax=Phytophthora nicotianae TaxID=4792 RepID=W2Q306_PHYN3|nr:hypothetical protein PPTG_23287 [Phytophthora nicotianae INRA-310]ETL89979.1 hypothetical protein L917_11188 [Phytophthora nicotianae]ETN06904.1 hypothetical protein PPTG_23287 [Phytophthora nicotianae INRA-310]